jgi:hypothetical protein
LLGRVIPNASGGVNEANKALLAREGAVIGRGIEEFDRISAAQRAQSAATGQPFWSLDKAAAKAAYDKGVESAAQRNGVLMGLADEVKPVGEALEEPGIATMRQLWDTKAALGRQAFPVNATRVGDKQQLLRAGQQESAREIERQLESRIGPDMMDEIRSAMKRYSLGKRIEGTVEDAAMREASAGGPGLKDQQWAQVLSEPGLKAGALSALSSMVRGRGNAAAALYAPRAAAAVGESARSIGTGVAAELGASVADPMGPLRQYLGLPLEERRELDAQAFSEAGL